MRRAVIASLAPLGIGLGASAAVVLLVLPVVPHVVSGTINLYAPCHSFSCPDHPVPPSIDFPPGTAVSLRWDDSDGINVNVGVYLESKSSTTFGSEVASGQGSSGMLTFDSLSGTCMLVIRPLDSVPSSGTSVNYSFYYETTLA